MFGTDTEKIKDLLIVRIAYIGESHWFLFMFPSVLEIIQIELYFIKISISYISWI